MIDDAACEYAGDAPHTAPIGPNTAPLARPATDRSSGGHRNFHQNDAEIFSRLYLGNSRRSTETPTHRNANAKRSGFPFQSLIDGTRLSVPRRSLRRRSGQWNSREDTLAWEDTMVIATEYRAMAAEHHVPVTQIPRAALVPGNRTRGTCGQWRMLARGAPPAAFCGLGSRGRARPLRCTIAVSPPQLRQ
jgi:hypothetical protein